MARKNDDIAKKQRLLTELKAFDPDFSHLQKCLQKRNFFRILGLETLEIRHSNMLAWLLDSEENHDLYDGFVRRFFEEFLNSENCSESTVRGKYPDIL